MNFELLQELQNRYYSTVRNPKEYRYIMKVLTYIDEPIVIFCQTL